MKLLIGGSPCTHWSIAQTHNRETKAEGLGWELFQNYVIALQKYKPDYFLYENNKSMSKEIRKSIDEAFGFEAVCINSALVSAQNRQRLYWVGKRYEDGTYSKVDIEQPDDRGIILRDILETIVGERAYNLAEPVCMRYERTEEAKACRKAYEAHKIKHGYHELHELHPRTDGKTNTLSTVLKDNPICEPVMRVPEATKQGYTDIYPGECVDLEQPNSKTRRGRRMGDKANCLTTANQFYEYCGNVKYPIYEVKDGMITIKGKQYPIKLVDGFYIIRKLTVIECMRLQTVPEWYAFPVSNSQAYKMLGNGWTVEVIKHLMSHMDGIFDEELDVLSMFDGMSCGQIALKELGCAVRKYYATEIDKYAIQTTQHNFPNTIQLGDAFQVREEGWTL